MSPALFDFSQRLVDLWRRSNSEEKRQIVDCVSLNRSLTAASLCVTKRKPFDWIAERPFLEVGVGDWYSREPSPRLIAPMLTVFGEPTLPFLVAAGRLLGLCA